MTPEEQNELERQEWAKERDAWYETAQQHCRNELYYMGLLDEIAENFGEDAYQSDDGSIQDDPIRAKLPELVASLRTRLEAIEKAGEGVVDARAMYEAEEGHVDALDIDEAVSALAALLAAEKGEK